ncbi:MAG: sensor histidine kinase [Mobilicoccus sp.]|nr:sensor histidine kinase [Mobilicoccus sp.]
MRNRRRREGPEGRGTTIYAAIFLVFTPFAIADGWSNGVADGLGATVTTLLFIVWYVSGYLASEDPAPAWTSWITPWRWMAVMIVLTAIATLFTNAGLMFLTFVAAGAGALLERRISLVVILAAGVAYAVFGVLLGIPAPWAFGIGLWTVFIGMTVWGGMRLSASEEALITAREEKAALAVDLERSRLARDLHDILGHSLTVVTVKAQLAGRLVDVDPERAKAEIAEVERLARDALTDVRATVRDYRTLSLATELAGARRALAAAEIEAEVPGAVDDVASEHRELFAWVVREGTTNIVRHSGARHVVIRLSSDAVEIEDDGVGVAPDGEHGTGLLGLGERARNAGATLTLSSGPGGRGTVLRVAAGDNEGDRHSREDHTVTTEGRAR